MELPTPPPRVFVDSSVLFAAAYSGTGSAHDLMLAASRGRIAVVLSAYVLAETERNLLASAPRAYSAVLRFRFAVPFAVSRPSRRLVMETLQLIVAKDASIITAARASRVTLVATYDRGHLLAKRAEIREAFGITVATPDEILAGLDDPR